MRSFFVVPLVAMACTASPPGDVVGPYTGEARRFVVDSISLPSTREERESIAVDLNGDGLVDNQLGALFSTLRGQGNLTNNGDDMIAAGVIASSVIITADDFTDDPTVSVRYLATDGAAGVAVGGVLEDGRYVSNRIPWTSVPGEATVRLPVFVDADPSELPLIGVEMELEPDGRGGFDAIVRGGVPHSAAVAAAYRGILQLLESNPGDHIGFMRIVDQMPADWRVTTEELAANALLDSLLAADLTLYGEPTLSIAFRVHLSPCAAGRCSEAVPVDHCGDRVVDSDETDIDCGGSCRPCTAGFRCAADADCEAGSCASGTCAVGSCENGVRDSFEIDVDCGIFCGATCALGEQCFLDSDCTSGQCGEPYVCPPESWFCIDFPAYGTCM